MRENIGLYKGKRLDNGEWIEGALFDGKNFTVIADQIMQSDWHPNIDNFRIFGKQVVLETVGRYTGLTDKNGKKIFEGDILEGDLEDSLDPGAKWRSEIIWGKFGWNCKGNKMSLPMDEYDIREGEVIGNIHDNPELLEVKEHE